MEKDASLPLPFGALGGWHDKDQPTPFKKCGQSTHRLAPARNFRGFQARP